MFGMSVQSAHYGRNFRNEYCVQSLGHEIYNDDDPSTLHFEGSVVFQRVSLERAQQFCCCACSILKGVYKTAHSSASFATPTTSLGCFSTTHLCISSGRQLKKLIQFDCFSHTFHILKVIFTVHPTYKGKS